MNDESTTVARLPAKKPCVAVWASIQFSPVRHRSSCRLHVEEISCSPVGQAASKAEPLGLARGAPDRSGTLIHSAGREGSSCSFSPLRPGHQSQPGSRTITSRVTRRVRTTC